MEQGGPMVSHSDHKRNILSKAQKSKVTLEVLQWIQ